MPDSYEIILRDMVLEHYPAVQGIYLFGSYGTAAERVDSDVDVAVLLPPSGAATAGELMLSPCQGALGDALKRDVDLVNLRRVSTVFQKEIVAHGRLVLKADAFAVDEFEMLVLSYYQKLNEERAEILRAFEETGRAYDV